MERVAERWGNIAVVFTMIGVIGSLATGWLTSSVAVGVGSFIGVLVAVAPLYAISELAEALTKR